MFKSLFESIRTALRRVSQRRDDIPTRGASNEMEETIVSSKTMERLTGVSVRDIFLYQRALTHRSMLRGVSESHLASNERLEFLGDAVLGFIVAEYLYHHFPGENEGFLTRLRAKLVNGQALAQCARMIDLNAHILMSENMEQSGGRQNQTILADAFEALIGAVYLDKGIDDARRFIHRSMLDQIDLVDLAERHDNYKSMLLEYVQAQGWAQPEYRIAMEEGPSHDKVFTVEVNVKGRPYGKGTAGSKKKAEQKAAREALRHLRKEEVSEL